MGIAEEYAKRVKTPLIRVTLTRFLEDDIPGVDAEGHNYYPEVISCDINYGFDQGSSTCTLVIKTPLDLNGDPVRFEPMDRVKVEQGWNKTSTLRTTFFGFVDQAEFTNPPQLQRLECRDMLKLAQDNYLTQTNRKVYFKDLVDDELDQYGNPMGGQAPADRTAKKIISTLLTESGIPESRQQLDFVDYPASGAIVIGNNAVAVFVYESAMEAINRICDLIGYRIWADPVGQVQCKEVRMIAGETASVYYRSQKETYDSEKFTVVTPGNLISVESRTDDDLRNWVTVIGYGDLISTVAGESEYVPNPPRYRRTEIRSYLLDTQELVTTVAQRVYSDLNRLRHTATATIEGDPRIGIGQTIGIYDPYATAVNVSYVLYDYSSRFAAGEWTMILNLVGGAGAEVPGSPPIENVSPVALFDYRIETEVLSDGSFVGEVYVNAAASYDPNGPVEDLSYLWVCSGYDNATGIANSYVVSGGIFSLPVTLTVTDKGDPPLSHSLTRVIPIEFGQQMEWKTIYVASGSSVWTTDDGGMTWVERHLY